MPALLADVGGTRVRLALHGKGPVGRVEVYPSAGAGGLEALIERFLAAHPGAREGLDALALCAAGPLEDGAVRLTNRGWRIEARALAERYRARCLLVNDFTAIAAAVTRLGPGALRPLGGGPPRPGAPRAVLGPGTGLGVSAALPDGRGGWLALAGEGGHVSLAAADTGEAALIERLRERFGHCSAERVLSGPGLAHLYAALAEEAGEPGTEPPAPEAIAEAAWRGADRLAVAALERFTGWLGAVAGDLALTFGARGGVYLGGGIVPAWGERFDAARFRARFEAKGRFRSWLAAVPCHLIGDPHPALAGLAALLDGAVRAPERIEAAP